MNGPKVSVVICSYNRAKRLGKAVQSVLEQEYEPFELIVVDDTSTDETPDVLARFSGDSRLRVIRRAVNSGLPSVARNEGSHAARGTYLAFLDSDDYWLPGKLRKQVEAMDAHPAWGLCHTFCRIEEPDGRQIYIRNQQDMPRDGDLYRALLQGCFITTSSVMVRRKLFERVGGFPEDEKWRIGEDRCFFLRVAASAEIGFVPEPLAVYCKHDDNICSAADLKQHVQFLLENERRMIRPPFARNAGDRRAVRGACLTLCDDASYRLRRAGDFRASGSFAWKACTIAPFRFANWKKLLAAGLRKKV